MLRFAAIYLFIFCSGLELVAQNSALFVPHHIRPFELSLPGWSHSESEDDFLLPAEKECLKSPLLPTSHPELPESDDLFPVKKLYNSISEYLLRVSTWWKTYFALLRNLAKASAIQEHLDAKNDFLNSQEQSKTRETTQNTHVVSGLWQAPEGGIGGDRHTSGAVRVHNPYQQILPEQQQFYVYQISFSHHRRGFRSKIHYPRGSFVLVEGDRGEDVGQVVSILGTVPESVLPRIIRAATREEMNQLPGNRQREGECLAHLENLNLKNMKFIGCSMQFDLQKLIVFYISQEKVDFRNLVRDLARSYRCRIWMERVENETYFRFPERLEYNRPESIGRLQVFVGQLPNSWSLEQISWIFGQLFDFDVSIGRILNGCVFISVQTEAQRQVILNFNKRLLPETGGFHLQRFPSLKKYPHPIVLELPRQERK